MLKKLLFPAVCGLLVCAFTTPLLVHAKSYLTRDEFLHKVTQSLKNQKTSLSSEEQNFQNKTLWLTGDLSKQVISILGHPYPKLRLRYQINQALIGATSVWYLEEIGKERPISFAVAVRNNQIQLIQVLEFRESRGQEIHIPAFAKQFDQLQLTDKNDLSRSIDGITGATLSVSAMKKIARLALLLDKTIHQKSTKEL